MKEDYNQLEIRYTDKVREFEETLSPEQKKLFYEIEFLKEKLDSKKDPA